MFTIKGLAEFDWIISRPSIFKLPYPFSALPQDLQLTSRWLIRNHHILNWEEGFSPYSQIENIFRKITSSYQIIYVKGKGKCNFIQNLIKCPIVELPDHPSLNKDF